MKLRPALLIVYAVMLTLAVTAHGLAATIGVEATRLKQLAIDKSALDVATTADGKLMFVLVPGEILIYSDMGDRPVNRIPVDRQFDGMTFAEKLDLLILSSSAGKKVDLVRIDLINEVSTDGSPYLGRADAKVTIAVFDDYQ